MQTDIRFWGGLKTIGGNIISLQYGNYRVISDFGALVGSNVDDLLDKSLTKQLLEEAKLPKIEGLYSKELLKDFDLISLEESEVKTIICLSHLHLDHIGSFGQLSNEIPVYALEESVNFYQQLAQTELLPQYDVNWHPVAEFGSIEHGPFEIQFFPVDHDTLGAASIYFKAPDVKIIYSGDWRLSGFQPEKVFKWADLARMIQPDILLMEGTTYSHVGAEPSEIDLKIEKITRNLMCKNENQLLTAIKQEIKEAGEKIVAFNGYPQNITRLVKFAELVNAQNRQLVMDKRYYQLMKNYMPTMISFTYLGEGGISVEEINKAPHQFAIQIDIEDFDVLFKLNPGLYLHSNGMPLGSYDPVYEPFVNQLVNYGWDFVLANTSGHASTSDLLLVNRVINAKVIVPWHTFQPKLYGEGLRTQGQIPWLPKYDEVYNWAGLKQTLGVSDEED